MRRLLLRVVSNLLHFIYRAARSGEPINTIWTSDLIDEAQKESILTLLHVRSLLAKYNYEEISVATGRTDDPMPQVLLPEGEPHAG